MVIDKGTADAHGFHVGDRIGVAAQGPTRSFAISGIARFGSVNSLGGATIAVFDVATAQALLNKVGQFDSIFVASRPGVSPDHLVAEIKPLLPATAQIKTGTQQAVSDSKDIKDATRFIQYFLLAFAGIALFVGSFVIYNTLSITVAQRVREFATLRTLGASRGQILRSVLLEGLAIGLLASTAGLFLGLALAKGLNSIFESLGISLPQSGTVFKQRTVIVSIALGTGITVLASVSPALRATRVPPIAAVREGAMLPPSPVTRRSRAISAVVLAAAVAFLAYGSFGGLSTLGSIEVVGVGCLLLFLAVGLVSPRLVQPIVAVLGRPAARVGGAAGALAGENASRNPIRTARTAAALMIGLALVTLVATLGSGLRNSDRIALEHQVRADYVVGSKNGFDQFPAPAGDAAARAPGVTLSASVREDRAQVFGQGERTDGISPSLAAFFRFHWTTGSDALLARLGPAGAVVEKGFAKKHGLAVGSRFPLVTPAGRTLLLRVAGIQAPRTIEKLDPLIGKVVISQAAFDRAFPRPTNAFTFLKTSGGARPAHTATLERALAPFPDARVRDRSGWVTSRSAGIGKLLNLLYVLLALSVVVSLFGMVNTLVLSVFERTREVGMLRAVGMTRRQVRRMVRHESVITALIGAGLGLPVGVAIAALLSHALASQGVAFSLPVGSLVAFSVVAVIAGILAAVFPARRAARLNVLEALAYE